MTCEASGKTSHEDKAAALLHIKNLVRRRGVAGGEPYRCDHCGHFHITKSKSNKPKKYEQNNRVRSTKAVW